MALVTGSANASPDTLSLMRADYISGLEAGEALQVAQPCYVKSDGKAWRCVGPTGTSASAAPFGFTASDYSSGEGGVILYGVGAIFEYKDSGLTPGQVLYINKTEAGMLDNAATMCDTAGVAVAIDARRIKVIRADGRKVGE